MKLLTATQRREMIKNHENHDNDNHDPKPVVKLFDPCGAATWLLTEIDEDNVMFGLCDLGQGFPELGSVSLDELVAFRGRLGLGIERDSHWSASKSLSDYTALARAAGRIVD